jgi:ABC-type transport system involved in multi-copper enzyme maturation permease subunit
MVLTRMTFRQAIRRKIVLTGLVLGICFLVVFSIGFHIINSSSNAAFAPINQGGQSLQNVFNSEKDGALLLAGLYAVAFLSIAMAALLGADTLASEINSGSMQTIITKPIRRSDVVVGKWLGFACLLGLYLMLMAGGAVVSVWLQSGYTPPNLFAGLILIYLESLLVMTIALLFSSRLTALATGGVIFGLYGMAFIGGWVEQFGAVLHSQTAINIGIITSLIIPSEAVWRRAAYEMQSPLSGVLGISPFGTTSVPSLFMIGYAVIYLLAALGVAVMVFQRRDL